MPTLELNLTPKMAPFLTDEVRFKVAVGGRAGTKSQTAVDILIHKVQTQKKRVCIFREFGSSIDDSVWTLIKDEIIRMNVPDFSITDRKILHRSGGFFKSKGLGRDSKSVKSYSGFDIFLVEEGDFLTDEIIRDLTPTLRKEKSELWVIFNPQSREDAVSKRFLVPFYKELLKDGVYRDDIHYVCWTNYDENPWFPQELEAERAWDFKYLPRAEYDHKWLGFFNDSVENAIIKAEWFDSAVDAHIKLNWKPRGIEVVAFDPSDLGPDDKGLAHRHGSLIKQVLRKTTGDVNEGMDWALDYALAKQVDLFTWDCDGMGVALNRQVETALHGKKIAHVMYKGSESPDNPEEIYEGAETDSKQRKTNRDLFKNKRAQKSWYLRDRFYNTWLAVTKNVYSDPDRMISLSSDIEEMEVLRAETCRIPRKPAGGMIQLYSKVEMKSKFKIVSPNLFDSTVMCFEDNDDGIAYIPEINYAGWRYA